ncbi:hypothetical protein JGUZn3_11010 [Entomobacter blattae]|uniref:Uncharacterized protein n=1 Tax=Entomobacter blattae TaxID=2762277 RepID=A0A7H1NRB8_9PROT|nr:hypothetical protein JGUZn3_11010 [Entomobacter blattae]
MLVTGVGQLCSLACESCLFRGIWVVLAFWLSCWVTLNIYASGYGFYPGLALSMGWAGVNMFVFSCRRWGDNRAWTLENSPGCRCSSYSIFGSHPIVRYWNVGCLRNRRVFRSLFRLQAPKTGVRAGKGEESKQRINLCL